MITKLPSRYLYGKKVSLSANIILCILTSLAGTFYYYEYFYGEALHSAVCLTLSVVIAAAWLICSAQCGRDGRIGFLICAYAFYGAPYVYLLWYGTRDNLHNYNKWLAMISKAAGAVLYDPFDEAAKKLGTSPFVIAAVLVISMTVVYTAAALIKENYGAEKSDIRDFENNIENNEIQTGNEVENNES